MPQRIAILFEYPSLYGGEHSMLQVLDCIDPGDFRFLAFAPSGGRLAEELRSRPTIEHVAFALRDDVGHRLSGAAMRRRLIELVSSTAPALLHANSLSMGRLTGAISDQIKVPCVAHLRDIIKLSHQAINHLNRNRWLIAVSAATRSFHLRQGIEAARTRVIHNGVDCCRFRPRPAGGVLRSALQLGESSFLILTIGQIGLRKGQDVLARAAPAVAEQLPDAQFVILGERSSQKAESVQYEQEWVARFEQGGLGDRLHRVGYRHDVASWMNEADLLVHPAKQEPLGRVLLEAAAAGLPIVATRVGGTEEILTDGQNAKLVPPGDAGRLADAILELAADKAQRARFADAARERVMQGFTLHAAASRLCDVWRQSLS